MSGYASRAQAVEVLRDSIFKDTARTGLSRDIRHYNLAGLTRDLVRSRGAGMGWSIEMDSDKFRAALETHRRPGCPRRPITNVCKHCEEEIFWGYRQGRGDHWVHHFGDQSCREGRTTVAEPRILYFVIDADCPNCGYPERRFNPETQEFGCSALNPDRCDYTSKERDR